MIYIKGSNLVELLAPVKTSDDELPKGTVVDLVKTGQKITFETLDGIKYTVPPFKYKAI